MASLWGELKRRNVVRVAIAYVIVGWLILQLTDVLVSLLTLPEWVGRLVFLLILIGLPLALLFAWAYELTPEGLKKEKDVDRSQSITHLTGRKLDFVIIGVLVAALGVFAFERFVLLPARAPAADTLVEVPAAEVQKSIAVLPFANMSPDPDQEYFSDGLSEELLNLLARIPELKVIGRTSSFAFKGMNEDLRVIGEKLGVATLLEGSVRKSGDRVRITAQLINVSDGSHLWSETYERTMTDIFAVQDDVAGAIIDALKIQLNTNASRGRPTDNAEAYALYLKARAASRENRRPAAKELILQAIELDPNYAEAYEFLAQWYWAQAGGILEAVEAQKLMGETAAKALAINPDLVFAQVMFQVGDLDSYSHLKEIEILEWAIRKRPNSVRAMQTLTFPLIRAGYLREAAALAERMGELDPLSPAVNLRLYEARFAIGRIDEGIAALEIAVAQGGEYAEWVMGWVYLDNGQDERGIAQFENWLNKRDYDSSWVRELVENRQDPEFGQAYLDRRIPEIIASMPENETDYWQQTLSGFYVAYGFLDRYFELILSTDLNDSSWSNAENYVYGSTIFGRPAFTTHPRYLEVAEAIGIVELWEQRGPPDFCEKVDGKWVCE